MDDLFIDDRFDASTAQKMAYHSKIIQAFDKIKCWANDGCYECELPMPDYLKMILLNKGFNIAETGRLNYKNEKIFVVSWKQTK